MIKANCYMYVALFSLRTFRQDCQSHIALKIDKSGSVFEISSLSMEHNHEISQVCYHLDLCALSATLFCFVYSMVSICSYDVVMHPSTACNILANIHLLI